MSFKPMMQADDVKYDVVGVCILPLTGTRRCYSPHSQPICTDSLSEYFSTV